MYDISLFIENEQIISIFHSIFQRYISPSGLNIFTSPEWYKLKGRALHFQIMII